MRNHYKNCKKGRAIFGTRHITWGLCRSADCGNRTLCSGRGNGKPEDGSQKANEQESGGSDLFQTDELFSDQDFDSSYDESTSIQIHLEGDSASCESENVEISGTTVTIKEGGTYLISGTL